MQRINALWDRGIGGKIAIVGGVLVGVLAVCCVIGSLLPSPSRQQSAAPAMATIVAIAATDPPAATAAPTNVPQPTDTPQPTNTPAPAAATETAETRYVRIAQAGATIPIARVNLPKGEWKAELLNAGEGPEVTLTMPVSVGLSNEQTVRQAKRHLSQVVKALFDGDPALVRVTAIGTTPDAADGSELPAVSIFVTRAAFAQWDGTAENLGEWRISPRYK